MAEKKQERKKIVSQKSEGHARSPWNCRLLKPVSSLPPRFTDHIKILKTFWSAFNKLCQGLSGMCWF